MVSRAKPPPPDSAGSLLRVRAGNDGRCQFIPTTLVGFAKVRSSVGEDVLYPSVLHESQ